MKALVVINPKSGRQVEDNLENLIAEEAKKTPFEFRVIKMKGTDDERIIRKEIETYKPEILAVAGGDGTVNFITQLLIHSQISLLIIPTGSANGMAKELNIGGRIENAIRLFGSGYVRTIDLLKINGRICIHLADVGLNARVVKRFEQDVKRGLWRYAKHLWSEIFLIKQYRFYIRYSDKEITRKAVSLTFANASKYGTGAIINPLGRLDDGKFELVIIRPFPRVKLLSMAWKMFTGKLQTSEYVEVISCDGAHIRSSKKTTLQIDGEVIGKTREIHIEILKHALKVLVPSANVR